MRNSTTLLIQMIEEYSNSLTDVNEFARFIYEASKARMLPNPSVMS